MVSPEIKSKVQELWDKFWSGGIANPLNAIEQITYLLFMKQIDESDQRRIENADFTSESYTSIFTGKFQLPGEKEENAVEKESLRWKNFKGLPANEMFALVQSKVFPFIQTLDSKDSPFARHMSNAVFLIPKASLLVEAVKKIDEIYTLLEKENRFTDAQGDIYEYLLDHLNQAGKNGQFRTPTHIIEMIVELVEPKLGDRIADPACGSSGFLLAAYLYILTAFTSKDYQREDDNGFMRGTLADKLVDDKAKETLNKFSFYGFDIDLTMIRIGLMNLMMHGIEHPNIDYTDTLSKHYNEDNYYNVVLANPPFTGSLDKGEVNETFTLDTKKTELLFLERIYKMLRIGGTAGVIVPQGVLFGSGKAFKGIRQLLIDKCELKAVISLPSGVFKPYAGVATAVLIFTKGGETKNVWFYEMQSDGRSLDDKRTPLYNADGSRNYGDVHAIVDKFKKRNPKKETDRTQQHFFVSKNLIVENEYDLSLNKYKEAIYETIKYAPPREILEKLESLEVSIKSGIEELKSML